MSTSSDTPRFVILRSGPVVPVDVLRLVWRLEHAGFMFGLTDEHDVWVSPGSRLTDADRDELRRWKRHIVALLDHFERTPLDEHLFSDAAPERPARTA